MGNAVTVGGLFHSLGIPIDERSFLKRDLLNEIRNQSKMGGELSEVTSEDLTSITYEFLKSDQFLRRRAQPPNPSSQDPPDDAQLHAWLLQLAMLWVDDRKRQVSQDDPSYSNSPSNTSFTSKKRKRSDVSGPSKMQTKKPNTGRDDEQSTDEDIIQPTNRAVSSLGRLKRRPENFFPPRSATLASNSDSANEDNDMSCDDDIADDFDPPPASQLISDRSEPRNRNLAGSVSEPHTPTTSRKDKEPVRNPPYLSPGSNNHMMPPTKPTSTNPTRTFTTQPQTINGTTSSPTQVRSFRSMTEIEQSDREVSSASSIRRISSIDLTSLSHNPNVIINERGVPPSPPPTISRSNTKPNAPVIHSRISTTTPTPISTPVPAPVPIHPQSTAHIATATATVNNANTNTNTNTTHIPPHPIPPPISPNQIPPPHSQHQHQPPPHPHPALQPSLPREDHLLSLIYNILAYISDCETYNNAIANDDSSSPREAQAHRIRAKAFAMLSRDVSSRVEAFLRGDWNGNGNVGGGVGVVGERGELGRDGDRERGRGRGVVSYCVQP